MSSSDYRLQGRIGSVGPQRTDDIENVQTVNGNE